MKKSFTLVVLFFCLFSSNAQNILTDENFRGCAQEEVLANILSTDPQTLARQLDIENRILQAAQNGMTVSGSRSNVLYTLPVVVHIVHNNGTENISDAQVIQGIADLNAAYANTGYYDSTSGVNTQIQFCLAQRDPAGQLTTGITRNVSTLTNVNINSSDVALKNLNRWNPYCYINIWLVKTICSGSCNILGYAYFPSSHGNSRDGIVGVAAYFGSSRANSGVQIHEMGHYLGLYHTFQGGCTNNNCLSDGDRVCDTPPDNSTGFYSCGAVVNTCTTDALSGFTTDQSDLYSDYMDYGNLSCFSVFTQKQVDRMQWHIANVRSSLLGCQSCLSPCVNPATAAFTASAQTIAIGGSVTFTNTSAAATSYTWTSNGTQFSTATSPTQVFNSAGVFVIKLRADNSDPNCFDEFLDTITVTCPVVAGFSQSAFQITPGQWVTFTNNSTGATSYTWVMDGTVMATTTNFSHTFNLSGDYSVYLIATNGTCSDTSSIFNFVHVGSGCNAYFTHTPANPSTCNPVTFIPDTTCNYSNYHWSFCDFDTVGVPTAQSWSTAPYGSNAPVGATLYRDRDGNYHGFFADYNNTGGSNRYYRVDFGNSMANTPVFHNLTISGITDPLNHYISIIDVDGVYYAFMVNDMILYRAKIGANITNNTFSAAVVGGLGSSLDWAHKVTVVKETNNFWAIMCDRNHGYIVTAYLGSNIENNVIQYTTHQNGLNNDQYFAFRYMRVKGKSYVFAADLTNNKLSRFDFGTSLSNTPTVTNLNNLGSGLTLDLNLFQNCNGSFDGYIVKEDGVDHKVFHLDSITAVPVIKGTFPSTVARMAGLSSFLVTDMGVTCIGTMSYTQKFLRFTFGTCNTTNAYSTDKFPAPVSFTTPGTRYVRLLVDQGLPTESSYCDAVTVVGVNNNLLELGSDTSNCYETPVTLRAGSGFSSYVWQDGSTDSVHTAFLPGMYSVTVTNYCGQTFTDSIRVSVDSTTQITLNDTTICAKDSVLLSGPSGFVSYRWTPSSSVRCDTCQTTYSKPSQQTTIYTLTAITDKGCATVGTQTVTVTVCTGIDETRDNIAWQYVRPNPAKDKLEIGLAGNEGKYVVKIYNALGQEVIKNHSGYISNQGDSFTMDVSTLSSGLYFLEVKHEKGNSVIQKIVKE
jgi:plastocyanin